MAAPKNDRDGIEQTIKALLSAGWQLAFVADGEEDIAVQDVESAADAVCAVDMARLYVSRDITKGASSYVFFVLGNDPEEVICDYTTDLSSVIEPLTDGWF